MIGSGRKSCAITTARRLGEFLGDERIKVGYRITEPSDAQTDPDFQAAPLAQSSW